jgi:hypothetical protein
VVSVDVGDVAERIDGIEGCHLASADAAALAAKLRLVRQRGKRLDCRARLGELSIRRVAEQLKECYEEVRTAGSVSLPKGVSLPALCPAK